MLSMSLRIGLSHVLANKVKIIHKFGIIVDKMGNLTI